MTQVKRKPELIPTDRLPHNVMRRGELYLKRQMFKVENAAVVREQRLYSAAFADIRSQAQAAADSLGLRKLDNGRASALWRDQVVALVTPRIHRLRDDVLHVVYQSTGAALAGGYYGRLWMLDMATKADVQINMPMLRSADVLHAMTEDIYSDLIQSLMGKQWRAQFETELDSLTVEIRRALGQGMIEGEGIDEIMRRVASSMGVSTDRRRGAIGSVERKGYRANFNRVQAITRTVINQVSNAGAIDAYRANSDILSGYEWLTAEDERVCPECEALDHTVYSFHNKRQPPEHPNCRCTVIPVIKPDALEHPHAAPRRTLEKWAQGYGMDKELAAFLVPQS